MIKRLKDVDINYLYNDNNKKDTLVFLHGWGQNIQMMMPIAEPFNKECNILVVDLPGYGQSSEPTSIWTVYDYAECINELVHELKIKNPILIGHSFGGKISLVYASKYKTKKLVLFGSPYCKEIQKLSLKTKVLKQLKKVPGLKKLEGFAKKHIGSEDYRKASPMMRDILVNTVNLDITEDVKEIKCPTLIVWGEYDEAVPLSRAYELEKLIDNAGVVVYEGCTHYAYLENLGQTINVLRSFFGSED